MEASGQGQPWCNACIAAAQEAPLVPFPSPWPASVCIYYNVMIRTSIDELHWQFTSSDYRSPDYTTISPIRFRIWISRTGKDEGEEDNKNKYVKCNQLVHMIWCHSVPEAVAEGILGSRSLHLALKLCRSETSNSEIKRKKDSRRGMVELKLRRNTCYLGAVWKKLL